MQSLTFGAKKGWEISSFETKLFIENKGQFSLQDGTNIKFCAEDGGTKIYYKPNGLTYLIQKNED